MTIHTITAEELDELLKDRHRLDFLEKVATGKGVRKKRQTYLLWCAPSPREFTVQYYNKNSPRVSRSVDLRIAIDDAIQDSQ